VKENFEILQSEAGRETVMPRKTGLSPSR